jgi:hypothetical protein
MISQTFSKAALVAEVTGGDGRFGTKHFRLPGIAPDEPRGDQAQDAALNEKVVWQLLQRYVAAGGELEQIRLLLGHASVQANRAVLGHEAGSRACAERWDQARGRDLTLVPSLDEQPLVMTALFGCSAINDRLPLPPVGFRKDIGRLAQPIGACSRRRLDDLWHYVFGGYCVSVGVTVAPEIDSLACLHKLIDPM